MIPLINEKNFFSQIKAHRYSEEYYAFYSSWFDGIIKDPRLMLIPVDDHMVHRGDGIFEAMKAVNRSVYLFDEHVERFFRSAEKISIKPPFNIDQLKNIILETLRAANQDNVSIRVFLSRGPGDFSVNPYDAIGPQLYVMVLQLKPPAPEKYMHGVIIGKSDIPAKPSWMAQIKSCNYLPNVLMKKEAVERKLDYVISVDKNGFITESATENIMIIDSAGTLVHPPLENILKGTTMIRTCELARENNIPIEIRPISVNDLLSASEAVITGTSLNVLPVVKFENNSIGQGQPGPVAKKLNDLILYDIQNSTNMVKY